MAQTQDTAKATPVEKPISRALLGTTVLTSLLSMFAIPHAAAQGWPGSNQTGTNGANSGTAGGAGGAGGVGFNRSGTGDLGTLTTRITGGNGGTGGPMFITPPFGFIPPGIGGVGGAGLVFDGVGAKSAIINNQVSGGVGGAGGSTGGSTGAGGQGGAGIVGGDLSLTLGDMVSGGAGGVDNGTGQAARGFAIDFTSGTNALTLTSIGGLTGGINVASGASLQFAQPTNQVIANIISGGGAISKTGASVLTLTGTNTYSGTTTISAGTLRIGAGGTTGSLGGGAVTNNATLAFDRSDNVTVSNVISGSGLLFLQGTGRLILTGENNYTGITALGSGTVLQIGNGGTTGTLGTGEVVTGISSLVFNRSNDLTVANNISGSGGLTKQGAGVLTLTGTNSYSGATSVEAGTLQINNNASLSGNMSVQAGATLALNLATDATRSESLSGEGTFAQRGPGALTLSGNINMTGQSGSGTIEIASGSRLNIADPGMLFATSLGNVVNNGTLALDRTVGLVSTSGAGQLLLQGGTSFSPRDLIGVLNHTGGTRVASGAFWGLGGALGGGTSQIIGTLTNEGSFNFRSGSTGNGANITNSGQLRFSDNSASGTAQITSTAGTISFVSVARGGAGTAIVLNGSSRFDITSSQASAGGGVRGIEIGSLAGSSAAATVEIGGYPETLGGPGRQLTVGGLNTSTTFAGQIINGGDANSGPGSLVKTGTGTLTLTGASTYNGPTTVNQGTLIVNGSLLSPVTLATGALLGGSGSTGGLTVGGTFSPGNSPGTFTVNGNLSFAPGSVYIVEIDGPLADRTNITGSANLNGTLQLIGLGGSYIFGTPYTILSAAGGLGGSTFATVAPTGFGASVAPEVTYTGTQAQVTLRALSLVSPPPPPVASPPPPPPPAVSPPPPPVVAAPAAPPAINAPFDQINPLNVATGIDKAVANGANPSAFFTLFNSSRADQARALNTLSGEVHDAADAVGIEANDQFLRVMLDPFVAARLASEQQVSVWAAPFGLERKTDGEPSSFGSAKTTLSTDNFGFGVDKRVNDQLTLGAAVATGTAKVKLGQQRGEAEADVNQIGAYALAQAGPATIKGAISYADMDVDTDRTTSIFNGRYTANYGVKVFGARLEGALPLTQLGPVRIDATGALRAMSNEADGVREAALGSGGAAALAVSEQTTDATRSELGLKIATPEGRVGLTGYAQLGWAHEFDRKTGVGAAFVGLSGSDFTVYGARADEDTAILRAGLNAKLTPKLSIAARIEGESGENVSELGATLQARLRF